MLRRVLHLMLALAAVSAAHAQSPQDLSVCVSAVVEKAPPRISLSWPADPDATGYLVRRKLRDAQAWGNAVRLDGSATSYGDTDVMVGAAYEYGILRIRPDYSGAGYIYAGIEVPLVEERGKVILIVDRTVAEELTTELRRLQQDLIGDGWTPVRHDVDREAPVNEIKALIRTEYEADPARVEAVFLFGRVPVPYSGDVYPDHHTDHRGAWPADVFYGDMDGDWTDSFITSTSGNSPRNHNVPEDGKFDQVRIPSSVELQVGRVDLSGLPVFSESEVQLLRRYLDKNHRFRHKAIDASRRGLIDDHFGLAGTGEAFAVNGWRNFAPLFGSAASIEGDWLTVLQSESFLWGFGCGSGTFTGISGVAQAEQLAAADPKVVFAMFFGSYFGDWDSEDNLLRAALATPTYTLAAAWAGRPHWILHHMGLGETIGFSTRVTQNNTGDLYLANSFARFVHIALMGDPTLRLHVVAPPRGLAVRRNNAEGVDLSWEPSPDEVAGYAVYRSSSIDGKFMRLHQGLISETRFVDPEPGSWSYMVRAVKLETSGSGTYFNSSQGVFQHVEDPDAGDDSHLRIASMRIGSGDAVRIATSNGVPGKTYVLFRSDRLVDPVWEPLGSTAADARGVCEFADGMESTINTRYYIVGGD